VDCPPLATFLYLAYVDKPYIAMFRNISPSIYPAMRQWEGAGVSLGNALTNFLNLSVSLETKSLAEGTPPRYIATRIDLALESFHALMDRQMAQTRSTLSQARNRVLSPIYRFPEEVLFEIFMHTAFSFDNPSDTCDIEEHRIICFYRRLHNLIGVCSAWRNVILSRGIFWSIVPMVHSTSVPLKSKYAASLSLERSQGRPIHFVAFLPYHPQHFPYLFQHASRFRTVNISTGPGAHSAMQLLLSCFLDYTFLGRLSLSQLSLCHTYEPSYYGRFPERSDYIMYNEPPEGYAFNKLISNLSILRIKGAQFCWGQLVFSHQLTELHLQDITVPLNSWLISLVNALSSATQLRNLKFIGVKSAPDPFEEVSEFPQITLTSLKSLFIRNLNFSALSTLLSVITSRSHCLTLFLTVNSFFVGIFDHAQTQVNIQELGRLLSSVMVHTLLLDGGEDYGWLTPYELKGLVLSMPALKILKIRKWVVNEDVSDALRRPPEPGNIFPSLNSLHLSQTSVWGEAGFRDMVASHSQSLELAKLGIEIYTQRTDDHSIWNVLDGNELQEFWDSLHRFVPRLEKVDHKYEPPEFEEVWWQMWN
ncbi:unnamed protein product, partial [Rhizoctonia solani]